MSTIRKTKNSTSEGRTYKGESQKARAQERKAKLLNAAFEVIGTEGFKAATVRKVCTQAGLTERYYYEAFGNSTGMLKQVYEAQTTRLARTMFSAVSSVPQSPAQMAEAALTALFGAIKKDPRMARVLYIEVIGVNEEIDQAYQKALQRFEDLLVGLSRPIYPKENVTDLDEKLIASALVGAVTQVSRNWVLADFDRSITLLVNNMMNLVVGVITHLQNRQPV